MKLRCFWDVTNPASAASIYQRIYADKRKGGTLHLALRCQKMRKKRHTGRVRRGSIPNQVSIDLRSALVAERARFGDWEADLVIGAGQKQALVTINERISRYSLIAHVPFKTATLVSDAMIAMLKPFFDVRSHPDDRQRAGVRPA